VVGADVVDVEVEALFRRVERGLDEPVARVGRDGGVDLRGLDDGVDPDLRDTRRVEQRRRPAQRAA
jgi:hypothetical protein